MQATLCPNNAAANGVGGALLAQADNERQTLRHCFRFTHWECLRLSPPMIKKSPYF
jgi:hypothetical protein